MAESFNSVVMYGSWLEVARKHLPEDKVAKLMVQLMEYGLTGAVPNNDDQAMMLIFEMAKPNIDSNIQKKVSGRKGGRGKKSGNGKTYGLSNVNGNVNANANGNVNGNDNGNTPPPGGASPPGGAGASPSDGEDDDDWRPA